MESDSEFDQRLTELEDIPVKNKNRFTAELPNIRLSSNSTHAETKDTTEAQSLENNKRQSLNRLSGNTLIGDIDDGKD